MSKLLTSTWYPTININLLFSPQHLNFPALPPHFPLAILSALFYGSIYGIAGPFLYASKSTPNVSPTIRPQGTTNNKRKLSRYYWIDNLVSFTQSVINSVLAIYLLVNFHVSSRTHLTPQERILGYHEETARVLAIAMGYFLYHLWEAWNNREVYGYSMFLHGVCAIGAVSLGFVSLSTFSIQVRETREEDLFD
jgi:hypothetical protein